MLVRLGKSIIKNFLNDINEKKQKVKYENNTYSVFERPPGLVIVIYICFIFCITFFTIILSMEIFVTMHNSFKIFSPDSIEFSTNSSKKQYNSQRNSQRNSHRNINDNNNNFRNLNISFFYDNFGFKLIKKINKCTSKFGSSFNRFLFFNCVNGKFGSEISTCKSTNNSNNEKKNHGRKIVVVYNKNSINWHKEILKGAFALFVAIFIALPILFTFMFDMNLKEVYIAMFDKTNV